MTATCPGLVHLRKERGFLQALGSNHLKSPNIAREALSAQGTLFRRQLIAGNASRLYLSLNTV